MGNNIKNETTLLVDTSLSKDEAEFRAHENKEKLLLYQKSHDKKILTRRDFLATGVVSFAGTLMSQSLFSMLMPASAKADIVCAAAGSSTWVPMVTLNLNGGANLSSHFLPRDTGGQLVPSYSKTGWGKAGSFGVDTEFANGAKFFQGSTWLTGVRTTASTAALASTSFVGMPVRSQDDSAANHLDITGIAQVMGYKGKLLANLGTAKTSTGAGMLSAYTPPQAPLVVSSYLDITGALSVGGSLAPLVSSGKAGRLFASVQQMSNYQAKKMTQLNDGGLLENIITCRSAENTQLISNPDGNNTDPLGNAVMAKAFNLAANTSKSSRDYVFASMVYNALNGNAGSANLTMGGYDYHNGTRTAGDAADMAAGSVMGQIIEAAYNLGKPLFIMMTTDGATTSAESDVPGAPWASDGGVRGCAYMLYVDPTQKIKATKDQLGAYTADQAADDSFISSPEKAGAAMFVNWLSVNGQLASIDKALPRTLNSTDIDKMKMFG